MAPKQWGEYSPPTLHSVLISSVMRTMHTLHDAHDARRTKGGDTSTLARPHARTPAPIQISLRSAHRLRLRTIRLWCPRPRPDLRTSRHTPAPASPYLARPSSQTVYHMCKE